MTISESLRWANIVLKEAMVEDPEGTAGHLLDHCLGIDPTIRFLKSHERVLSSSEEESYRWLIHERSRRIPLQYLLGKAPFFNDDVIVDQRVLIPRPETEQVVEVAIQVLRKEKIFEPVVFEIGTGSGVIAVSLAKVLQAKVWAGDLSVDALDVARANIQKFNVEKRISLLHGDLFQPFYDLDLMNQVDLVISNPPYIKRKIIDELAPEISQNEPRSALDGGEDGCDFYRRIVPAAIPFLKPGGWMVLELGDGQREFVYDLIASYSELEHAQVSQDVGGKDRVVAVQRSC